MDFEPVNQLLEQGIDAVKRGHRAHGQALLMRVVEQDERNEPAWLWLSLAVEDAQDKIIALENVLAINPDNATARANLRWWRQKAAAEEQARAPVRRASPETPAAEPEPETAIIVREEALPAAESFPEFAAPTVVEMDDGINDPYQCAYCGKPTDRKDKRCPHCGRSLLVTRPKTLKGSAILRTATLLIGLLFVVSLFETVAPWALLTTDKDSLDFVVRFAHLDLIAGKFNTWPSSTAVVVLSAAVFRSALYAVLWIAVRLRLSPAYYGAAALLTLDWLWSLARLLFGWTGWAFFALDAGFALLALWRIFASGRDFGVITERLLTQPDRGLRAALDYYRQGHEYRRRGQWALAVAHWRFAVGAAPKEVQYYKDLGIGYAQIGRYQRSLRALEEAQRQSPKDVEIAELIALAKQRQAQAEGQPAQAPAAARAGVRVRG